MSPASSLRCRRAGEGHEKAHGSVGRFSQARQSRSGRRPLDDVMRNHPADLVLVSDDPRVAPLCLTGAYRARFLLLITADELRHPQLLNSVWLLTALFGPAIWLWFYYRLGRLGSKASTMARKRGSALAHGVKPFAAIVAETAAHRGSGCTLGHMRRVAGFCLSLDCGVARLGLDLLGTDRRDLGPRLHFRIRLRHRLSVLYHRADAASRVRAGHRGRSKGRPHSPSPLCKVGMYAFMSVAHF